MLMESIYLLNGVLRIAQRDIRNANSIRFVETSTL